MKVLVDTQTVLDLLLDREPFAAAAAGLFAAIENGRLSGFLGATTVTALHRLLAEALGGERANSEIGKLLTICEVAPVTRPVLETALKSGLADFEDAVVHAVARHTGADVIVTRRPQAFQQAQCTVFSAEELVRLLGG